MSSTTEFSDPFSAAVRRGDVLSADCPSREVLKHMTSRWGVLVLVILLGGMHRFSELRRKIGGVSEKMLSQTLQGLESDGLINRKSLPVVPPHVEYSLSPLGQEAAQHLEVMVNWIEEKLPEIMSWRHSREDDKTDG
ncbi:winged helix-turn-helix transcriptional regulator [Pseudomonas japonica]|uniref:winged helix-turn-helix transcriptional regulator n=1 Tax=Pseudomonas japonica TaxID=256466 RepID=UPI0015E2A71E|nr:helix-turn-helix domain-containing protein [Pseudomonas japonica]MBA1245480.1 helix-turn-helix transcriptional regulator [Pseudomonas japonica]